MDLQIRSLTGPTRESVSISGAVKDLQISVSESPTDEQMEHLRAGLTEHSLAFVREPGWQPLAVFAHEVGGELIGGVTGKVNWNWLHIGLLWVSEASRHSGLGSRLLARIEVEAKDRGCHSAHLDTLTYQAQPFYERRGYRVFGTLEEYLPGQSRVFLRKSL